jgi:thiamine biosynthesis lipoprotein
MVAYRVVRAARGSAPSPSRTSEDVHIDLTIGGATPGSATRFPDGQGTVTATPSVTAAGCPLTPADDRIVARHSVHTSTASFHLILIGPAAMTRRHIGEALADAVAELRAIDVTYSPHRPKSLVSLLRRSEITPDSYPPLADIVARCDAMRTVTDGWFDAWAVPGGFDPSGLLKGWAVERAAARLRAAGITDYAVISGADVTVRGHAPCGGPWRIAVHDPYHPDAPPMTLTLTEGAIGTSGLAGRRGHVINPRTGEAVDPTRAAIVIGPDLAIADAYATALCAAGPDGLRWFPTVDGYRALVDMPSR